MLTNWQDAAKRARLERTFDPTDPTQESPAQIALRLGLTRPREPWEVNQAYRLKRWEKRRARAIYAVRKAIERGELERLPANGVACVECGDVATCYDHRDYEKPLEVRPTCSSCNNRNNAKDAPVFEDRPGPYWLDRRSDIELDLTSTLQCCKSRRMPCVDGQDACQEQTALEAHQDTTTRDDR